MNANELADSWEQNLKPHERHGNHAETMYWVEQYRLFGDKAATMLRQQALEIKALHQILGYEGIEVGEEYLAECVEDLRKAQEK